MLQIAERSAARLTSAPLEHKTSTAAADTRQHIAIVRQSYRDDGGAERFVSKLLSALGTRELDTSLITRSWQDHSSDHTQVNFITRNPHSLGRLTRDWGFARAVRQVIRESRFDLVQTNERIAGCDIYRAGDGVHRVWLERKSRVQSPIAKITTRLNPNHLYVKWEEKRVFEHPGLRAVICNSIMVKNEILNRFKIAENKIHVIYNAVDSDRFHPDVRIHRSEIRSRLGISQSAPVFLFIGSGFERKGLGKSIEAIAGVLDTHLVVVGKAKRNAKYLKLARCLGCAERLHFAGVATDVLPYYGCADALLLPTLYDPFPNVILEAMACALPVITTNHCGAVDIIDSKRNGFICDALDVTALRDAMNWTLVPDQAAAMGQAARETILPMTTARMQNELAMLYRSILD